MTKTIKQGVAVFAIIAQLLILLPISIVSVNAEESTQSDSSIPILNETIVGTVNFQSFNFLGNNSTGEDATEYHTTFYYTDDYFSRSAINENANQQVMKWSDLEDISMATCSMDFTLAAMTSSKGNVIRESSASWNNTDYSNKDSNVKNFLNDCGFTNIETYGLNEKPTMDSIGYTIASKQIRVWDAEANENKDYTVVAVGIRGAGYDSEWADNVKIGTQGNGANVVRHEGFDNSAKTVCAAIESYNNRKHIDSNVKYWVTGFSRAAAVANLTAGYLTDGKSIYHADQKDIYGYTWECPQAASSNENALKYKNIHNIINPLDAVPKVSPSGFRHQRLGVDYQMPYHKTVSASQNQTYYNRMYEVLKTVAVGSENGERDPLLDAVGNYPYNTTLPIYTLTATQLIADAIGGNITTNFGTVAASTGLFGNVDSILGGNRWYMDDFIDNLIDVFLTSSAWDRGYTATTNVITHRTRFIDNYQEDFRVALGYMLDFSGPAFLGLVDKLLSAVGQSIGISDAGMGLAFLNFYNDPKGSYASYNVLVDRSWRGKPKKDVLITESQGVVKNVVANMTAGYSHPTITRARLNQALEKLTAVVIDLYADELDKYESQYFGTSLHWMNTILSTHEQETVLSWIMSLDPNHMNRSFRTLTVPKNTTVQLYEFRNELGETLSATGVAPVVAEFENGDQVFSKDQRIYVQESGTDMIIRYPASLDIRADIKTSRNEEDLTFEINDFRTTTETIDVENVSQYERLSASGVYSNITSSTGAAAINSASNRYDVPMSTKDTLHIMTSGMSSYNDTSASYNVDKSVYVNTIAEGQFIHDGTETSFQKIIRNDDGEEVEPAFLYTSTSGTDMSSDVETAHLGRKFSVTLPEVQNGHFVEKYYTTDATEENDQQLSTDGDANLPSDSERIYSGDFTTLEYGQSDELKDILELEDIVFHVFYSGSPEAPATITRIIDFNSKMVLATNADEPKDKTERNGSFELDSQNNAIYQLSSGKLSSKNPVLNSAYASADTATIKGIFDNESKPSKKKVTVVPASSIYFNDQLAEETIYVGDGSGYNADMANSISQGAQNVSGTFYFTFYGTGIDVYCTTHENGGYVSAAVFTGSGESACVKANRIGSAKTVRNYSVNNYYNTPAVSFTGLTSGTYTLKLVANDAAQYKLDGVRVYNPVQSGSAAETELNKTDEANATYLNLRSVLLNDDGVGGFTVTNEIPTGEVDPSAVSGVLFIDDVSSVVTTSNWYKDEGATEETWHDEPGQIYQSQFDVYKANGPKNEIYLNNGQAVTFQLNTAKFDENTKVYIGLSAPKTGSGDAVINGKAVDPAVTTVMDMYYPIDINLEHAVNNSLSVTVENAGSGVISVTNLKITGVADLIPAATQNNEQEVLNATRALFAPMTMKAVRMAVNNGVDPEAETVEPEEPSVTEEPAVTEDPEDPTVTEDPTETENPDDGSLVIDEPEETETPAPSVKPNTPAETGNTIQKVVQSITRSISSFFKSIFRR